MAEKLQIQQFLIQGQELYLGILRYFISVFIKRLTSSILYYVYVFYFIKSHILFSDSVFSEHVQAGSQQGTTTDIAVQVEEQLWKGYH